MERQDAWAYSECAFREKEQSSSGFRILGHSNALFAIKTVNKTCVYQVEREEDFMGGVTIHMHKAV